MTINDNLIQDAIAELQLLALKKPLEGYNLSKAKQLMGTLREAGYTNQQVSELTNEAWTEPTIKLYTRGIEVKDSSVKQNEVKLISEMIRKGLNFEDVQFALSLKTDLDSRGLDFKAVSSLLEGAARVGLSLNPLIMLFQDIGEILPKPSINDLTNIITYRDELKTLGIGTSELRNLAETSRKYGGITGMLQAISTFEDLKSIQDEINKASADKQQLDTKVGLLHSEIETLQKQKEAIQRPLRLYEDLKIAGFDLTSLSTLAYTCKKYNSNAMQVLEAVNSYTNLAEIQLKTKELENVRQDEERRLKEIREQRAHLQTVLDMSNRLLYEFNYSIPGIQELHNMAKKYDDPIEVFKALGRYGELKNIEEEIEDLSKKKTELLSKTREMNIQLQGLQGQAEAVKESLSRLLQPVSTEIAQAFDSAFQKLTSVYTEQFGIIK
jgi:predicted  nucleic acid-binding Zn-ribbon protein